MKTCEPEKFSFLEFGLFGVAFSAFMAVAVAGTILGGAWKIAKSLRGK